MLTHRAILRHMRHNSRERLIRISRKHGKPLEEVMELYSELKPVILKHTSLIHHEIFGKRYYMIIETDTFTRNFILLKNFLKKSIHTNNIYLYDKGLTLDIIIQKHKIKKFVEEIKQFQHNSIKYYEILAVLREEEFYGKEK